jgi:threonine synthase
MTSSALVCLACGESPPADTAVTCPACGGLLEVRHAPVSGGDLRALFDCRRRERTGISASGVWRFRELVLDVPDGAVVTYPEGDTPLLASRAVARWAGAPGLLLKHDGMNPTGSFKDRGMTVGVTRARQLGARGVLCASTGNTAASLAAYAALAGLPAVAVAPNVGVAPGKVAQIVAHGARMLLVPGDFDACLRLVREAAERLGLYLLNSVNPYRLEGQKTVAFEMLQELDWSPPDWIALPAGNLGNTAAVGAALLQARDLGLADRVPRIVAVQAAGAAPFARSYATGFAQRARVCASTVASAIRIGDPASYDRAVRAIRQTDGVVTAVTDDEILEAKAAVDGAGVGCEPASAASVAGVRRLVQDGVIGPEARVVAVLTGHLLKDPTVVGSGNEPVEIEASVEAVERAVG